MKKLIAKLEAKGKFVLADKIRTADVDLKDGRPKFEKEIREFFKENPNPDDDQIHELADKLGTSAHELEEQIYFILTEKLQGAPLRNFEPYKPEEAEKAIRSFFENLGIGEVTKVTPVKKVFNCQLILRQADLAKMKNKI